LKIDLINTPLSAKRLIRFVAAGKDKTAITFSPALSQIGKLSVLGTVDVDK